MFNDLSTPLSLLRPDPAQLRDILAIAARTPDHGKLAPWRFLHIRREDRAAFAAALETAYRAERPEAGRLEIEAAHRFAHQAPELVVVFSSPRESAKVPRWEQELSCGAACMNLLLAAHALGFAGGWVTGWAAFSEPVHAALGAAPGERIAGFFFLGSLGTEQEERPRPELDEVLSVWAP
jgi:nitroreductase